MIEYVYYDTWLMWNPGIILVSLAFSSISYAILTSTKEDGLASPKVARPRWVASLPSVSSVFWIGLYCLIPTLTYIMVSYWIDRQRAKGEHK